LNYTQFSDEELVVMILRGRAEALEALYDRYAAPSYSLALRILGDRGAAEEVVQDAFVTLWRKAGTYDPAYGRLYSWLLRIVRNRAIDELRRQRSPVRNSRVYRPDSEALADPSEAEAIRATELRSVVGGAMSELPSDQREVLEMAYLAGLSQREISEHTGVPLGTVKTRTRLALKKLRKVLGPLTRESVDLDGV
jgi:RNA polymerase sigma-70 factor (ECF subfamily)